MAITNLPAAAAPAGIRMQWQTAARLVFLLLAFLAVTTFRGYGISWDEHVQAVYGHLLLSWYQSGFQDQSAFAYSNLRYYGGGFDLAAAIANRVSPLGEYATRHLLGGLLGIVGFVGVWRLAKLLAGDRAGFFALILAATTPLLYGHNYINPKDAPLSWALLWTLYYACRAISEFPRPKTLTVAGFGLAFGAALGTRVTALIFAAYCAPALALYAAWRLWRHEQFRPWVGELTRFLIRLLPAAPIALAVMAVLWPWSVQSPGNIFAALSLFSSFDWSGYVLWNGLLFRPQELPRSYVIVLLLFQLPEVVIAGLAATVLYAVQNVRLSATPAVGWKALAYVVIVSAAAVPVLYAMFLRPPQYDGIRHMLFVLPPIIVLAAIGLDWVYESLSARGGLWPSGMATAFGAVIFWQIYTIAGLYPVEYAYFNNFAGGLAGAANRFDLDYWGVSLGDATHRLTDYVRQLPRERDNNRAWNVYVCGDRYSVTPYLAGTPLRYVPGRTNADFGVGIRSAVCDSRLRNAPRLIEIRRDGVVVSYVADLRSASRARSGSNTHL